MKYLSVLALTALPFLFTSCYYDNAEELYPSTGCDTSNVTYTNSVRPIVAQNCALSGCHNGQTIAGGYNLEAYAGIKQIVDNNRLLGTINHETGYSPMPQNRPKLSDCNIAIITKWVNAGAPNN